MLEPGLKSSEQSACASAAKDDDKEIDKLSCRCCKDEQYDLIFALAKLSARMRDAFGNFEQSEMAMNQDKARVLLVRVHIRGS